MLAMERFVIQIFFWESTSLEGFQDNHVSPNKPCLFGLILFFWSNIKINQIKWVLLFGQNSNLYI